MKKNITMRDKKDFIRMVKIIGNNLIKRLERKLNVNKLSRTKTGIPR